MASPFLILLALLLGTVAFVLVLIYVVIPLFRGLGWAIMGAFRGTGWLIRHLAEFVGGTLGDVFRFVSTIPVILVLAPITLGAVALGRWSAAAHFARSIRREFMVAGTCIYGFALRRPLKLVWMHGLLEGVEQRVPEAFAAAPGADKPKRRHQFDGYTITGSLPTGGSGAKLYIARPDEDVRRRVPSIPETVVIKSFVLEEGSALPQIVRESRALESAKKLGAVYEHGMDTGRFWYVMPYHEGDHLGIVTRQLHAESAGDGLDGKRLKRGLRHVAELTEQLRAYHREGLWHKDVKPENVIISGGGAQLVDLGLVTPLHSAMTLTTHGTEYFRDPELVRQALRGVKVHQVDGTKFDVFGVGAVLYFVIENDFPAHGPLSRFSRPSPDAVKWIIRRAMADYAHRYETSADLLADLRTVADASDPFAVRPADLPSMRRAAGEELVDEPIERDDAKVAAAGPPPPPIAAEPAASTGGESSDESSSGRPRIRRAGFLTGMYTVIGKNDAETEKMLDETDELLKQVGRAVDETGAALGAAYRKAEERSRPARDRLKAQRQRVARVRAEARRRPSKSVRPSTVGRHGPWRPVVDGITVLLLIVIGIGALIVMRVGPFESGRSGNDLSTTQSGWGDEPGIRGFEAPSDRPAVAFVGTPFDTANRRVAKIVERREGEGYDVVGLPETASIQMFELVRAWEASGRSEAADEALEDALEAWGLYGVLRVNDLGDRLSDQLVHSTREGARARTTVARLFNAAPPAGPLLLVNDHPRRHETGVKSQVDTVLDSLSEFGWRIDRTDVVEADLRTVLPIRTDAVDVPMTPMLADKLQTHELDGILRIIASPEDDRAIVIQLVRPDSVRATRIEVPNRFGETSTIPAPKATSPKWGLPNSGSGAAIPAAVSPGGVLASNGRNAVLDFATLVAEEGQGYRQAIRQFVGEASDAWTHASSASASRATSFSRDEVACSSR